MSFFLTELKIIHYSISDGVSSDFIIGTWDPHEAASAPTWNPYDRLPASGLVGGDVGAEKPPEEALPHISFDVPPSGKPSVYEEEPLRSFW